MGLTAKQREYKRINKREANIFLDRLKAAARAQLKPWQLWYAKVYNFFSYYLVGAIVAFDVVVVKILCQDEDSLSMDEQLNGYCHVVTWEERWLLKYDKETFFKEWDRFCGRQAKL